MTCNIILTILALVHDLKQTFKPAFFWGKISPNFNLKNMILIYTKDFPWKKWPKFTRFTNKNSKSSYFCD
jgi:hypothetical protein